MIMVSIEFIKQHVEHKINFQQQFQITMMISKKSKIDQSTRVSTIIKPNVKNNNNNNNPRAGVRNRIHQLIFKSLSSGHFSSISSHLTFSLTIKNKTHISSVCSLHNFTSPTQALARNKQLLGHPLFLPLETVPFVFIYIYIYCLSF